MTIPVTPQSLSSQPGPRLARQDDWAVLPFARDITETLQRSGHTPVGYDQSIQLMDTLGSTSIMTEKVDALRELFGPSRWTNGTCVRVIVALEAGRSQRATLPGAKTDDRRAQALRLLDNLTAPPRQTFTTALQLEALGYAPEVASKLITRHPEVVLDIGLWSGFAPEQARPADLYRAMALPGGLRGYDPNRVGNTNDEMYFASCEGGALGFGKERIAGYPGTSGVMVNVHVPQFMLEMSPPQGGDAVYPVLRARTMPDSDRPDLRPFISRLGSFDQSCALVQWEPYHQALPA